MSKDSSHKSPNFVHPEKPGAVGSRNSVNRDLRNEYAESKMIIDEEVEKILNHVSAKLPPEILEKLHISGNVKEILHNYFNQGFHNMYSRYLVTVEDEMSKKFRDMIDSEESKGLEAHQPKSIPEMIRYLGDEDTFNNAEIDQSVVNIYQQLQVHLNKESIKLEQNANKILQERSDVGAFISGENTYSIVKCQMSDNSIKPESVSDINLVINILENELLQPVFHFQVSSESIVKEVISDHILQMVDKEVVDLNKKLQQSNQSLLTESEKLFEKFKRIEKYIPFDASSPGDIKYDYMAQEFLDALKGLGEEVESEDYNPLSVKDHIKRIVDQENLRNKGFNNAVNTLTDILDTSAMGYQHIENFKNIRKTVIREYADNNPIALPDERFSITLAYYDDLQLREHRAAYCQQLDEFDREIKTLWNVFDRVIKAESLQSGVLAFDQIADSVLGSSTAAKKGKDSQTTDNDNEPNKIWDEISFIQPEMNTQEKLNETFSARRTYLSKKFSLLKNKIKKLYKYDNPPERVILEQRLDFLHHEFESFNRSFNPFHVQPGLVIDVRISTIKRQEITMEGMSNVLSEFLFRVSRGFIDYAQKEYKNNQESKLARKDKIVAEA
ncbi:MAG: cytoplasmic filament protein CfpA [Deltaproteobacteria bacterium]|nr:cytoplasmic filament protein CfpA [Deltaproteobacteria bacterium]